uniref:NADH dehydrogenase subunit 5 n=1 Tax=Bothriometopus macrocnemis TaxID=475769 RepID=UPI00211E607E|nr:NADH dehydrogenase subunit 5 [Bothriometopus macrocnemis]UTT72557.1 NADH dehydrogenase subunit 5 [Bothriometopus macrocnemis]
MSKYFPIFTIVGFFFCFVYLIISVVNEELIIFSMNLFVQDELSSDMTIMFDQLSVSFMFMVLSVSTCVLIYAVWYMEGEKNFNKFIVTLFMFIISMMFLCMSTDIYWVMVGWDGLGITSFFLIIFFQNWKSVSSGMVTLLSNRIGDVFIVTSICLDVFYFESKYSLIFIALGAITKSAQYPYSAWLPEAMAAPTPVSALVHSSTLVTAGIYLLLRFNEMFNNELVSLFILSVASMSAFLSISSSWGELDLKKIIALSTLSHLSMMILFISCKDYLCAIIHMISHAFFKSSLFMFAGILIHFSFGFQDIRKLWMNPSTHFLSMSLVFFSCASMVGGPFLAGFYSKEIMIMSLFSFSQKTWILWMTMFLVFGSCLYSARIIFRLLSNLPFYSYSSDPEEFNSTPLLIVTILSISAGSMIIWLTISSWPSLSFQPKESGVSKLFLFLSMFMGFFMGLTVEKKGKLWSKMWMVYYWSSSMMVFSPKMKTNYFYYNLLGDSSGILDWVIWKTKSVNHISFSIKMTENFKIIMFLCGVMILMVSIFMKI